MPGGTSSAYEAGEQPAWRAVPRESMNKPKVSVVIPTYNRAAKVQKTIESVLAQTVTDLEIVVVDDGSSDDTGKILGEVFGDRIRYYAQVNQGVSAARNKGIAEARGAWIAFLDSDDLWETDKIEWQLKALERFGTQCGACYTDVRLLNNPETRSLFQMADKDCRHEGVMGVNTDVLTRLVRPGGAGMIVCISSLLARADAVREAGGFDLKLGFYADSEFMFRLALLTAFCYVNRPLVWFDRTPGGGRHLGASEEWDKLEFVLAESKVRLEGFLRFSDRLPPRVRNVIRENLSTVHSGLANWYLETGQYKRAREAVSRAARLDLSFNLAAKWLLMWTSPQLALRTVQRRKKRGKDSFTV
jgi:glycosyltransferase involved in cell wall biosynthesis